MNYSRIAKTTVQRYVGYNLKLDIECALENIATKRLYCGYFFVEFPGEAHTVLRTYDGTARVLAALAELWGYDEPITMKMVLDGGEAWGKAPYSLYPTLPLWQWLKGYFLCVRARMVLAGWNPGDAQNKGGYGPDEGV